MSSIADILRDVLTLTRDVGGLRAEVKRLDERVEQHHEHIIKLETREEVLAERMAGKATEAVGATTAELFTRLTRLEDHCRQQVHHPLPP